MEVILDSNFIISCMIKNIPFLDQLEGQGFKVLLPKEVYQELKDLRLNVSHKERIAIDTALELLGGKRVRRMKLGGKTVDDGLIAFGRKGAYIATLDAGIKREVPNRVIISSAQKRIDIERS
mgnify:CR=1 FL=1